MLDAFIIQKIKEREKAEQEDNRIPLYIEEYPPEPPREEITKKEPVVIQL